jgi:hypothetical protein
MTNSRTMLAVGLAAATLVVFVVVIAMGGALQAGLAPWPGIGVAVLAVGAFAVPRERRSLVVAGLLAASGIVVFGLIKTEFLDGPLVSWPDRRNHPWSADTRTSRGGGCWGHTGQENEDCLTAVFSVGARNRVWSDEVEREHRGDAGQVGGIP